MGVLGEARIGGQKSDVKRQIAAGSGQLKNPQSEICNQQSTLCSMLCYLMHSLGKYIYARNGE